MRAAEEIVHLERIPFARSEIVPEARAAVAEVLASGWVTTGPETVRFEREIAERLGARDAVAVASCTTAIEMSLRALRLPPGAKVLASTMTFCGAVNAILHAGLQPVLVDVDRRTYMPNAATTADAVRRAGGVDAMTVLHFAGHPAPVDELAEAAGLPTSRVVEDAAHALGAELGGRQVGTLSAATCFSFYATKNLPIGEGGMVVTDDGDLADFVRRARLHGMSRDAWKRYLPGNGWAYTVDEPGLKANMTDVQAAIGRAHLRHFDGWQAVRQSLAARYSRNLADVPGVVVPATPGNGRHAWHLYVVRVTPEYGTDRDRFIAELSERGVDCSVHFIPLHRMRYLRHVLQGRRPETVFPGAEHVFPGIVSLPLYPSLTVEQVDRVCSIVAEVGNRLVAAREGGRR